MSQNIEIKAFCQDQERIKHILEAHQANFIGIDHQIDTYFKVNNGRLKLREGNIENFLIYYNRSNQAGPKHSEVLLYPSNPEHNLKAILTTALGTKIVIDKLRHIYFIDNVKFHLDVVKELGAFVEIEAIDKTGAIGIEQLTKQCHHYLTLLGIKESDLVEVSYSDLLLAKAKQNG